MVAPKAKWKSKTGGRVDCGRVDPAPWDREIRALALLRMRMRRHLFGSIYLTLIRHLILLSSMLRGASIALP